MVYCFPQSSDMKMYYVLLLQYSLLLTITMALLSHPCTDVPTAFHKDLMGIISIATIGLFAIIGILVSVTIGFSVQHWRRKR